MVACKPSITKPVANAGSADFTRYIAVGNSLTAGYADGGLYLTGQLNSYPSIIAKQMQSVNSSLTFTQPLFTDAQSNGSGYLKLTGFDATGNPITANVTTNLAVRGQITLPGVGTVNLLAKYTGAAIDNYGVPGIKLNDMDNPGYGNANPFMERLFTAASPTITTQYIDMITAKSFTFFTNWLGNNDALGYATSGGAGDVLTDKTVFNTKYTTLLNRLTATGAKGACATIPDVTTIPYFTTISPGLLLAGAQAAAQKAGVTPLPAAIYISASTNAAATTYSARAATATDLVVLTFPTALLGKPTTDPVSGAVTNPYPYGLHPNNPIESKYILDPNEAALVKDYVSSYNASIKTLATAKGLAVFDAFTFLTNVKTSGLLINGLSLNSNYISGGLFSLDGVHLTPRGYAIVANEYIKVINSKYGSFIPLANVTSYNGVTFP